MRFSLGCVPLGAGREHQRPGLSGKSPYVPLCGHEVTPAGTVHAAGNTLPVLITYDDVTVCTLLKS